MTTPPRNGRARFLALGLVLVISYSGCSNQYSEYGQIDMAASKEAAAKNGNDKTTKAAGRSALTGPRAGGRPH